MVKKHKNKNFAILGLGRFGMSIIETLSQYDVNILACDHDEAKVSLATEYATHVIQGDLSDEKTLIKIGLNDFDVVVLAMGESFETSLIATMIAKEQGARHIIVKARNQRQEKILKNNGADKVVLPEYEMGYKIAKSIVEPNILEILNDMKDYSIIEMKPLDEWIGKTLKGTNIRHNHGITILAIIKQGNKIIIPVSPDTSIDKDDVLLVFDEKNQYIDNKQ
ncbi:MAG: TrkA family potassium uptake protein [Clostridiales bacterium]|mgnify:CR=1 FL=1|nr:TrkA family potassium uptake protein [Clostridiales bacterium]